MSRLFATLVSGTLLVVPAVAEAGPLDPYLPADGVIVGHIVTFAVAPEDQAISRQFRHAVQDNMDWFKKAVTSNAPGKPLPYDRRMGVSEAQYRQLLNMKSEVKTGAAVQVAVERAADGSVAFAPKNGSDDALKNVRFAAGEKSVETPFGPLTIVNDIHQTDASAPIGVWNGVEWARVSDSDAEPSVKVAFGKREADGSGVLYYQVAPFKGHKEQSLVVFYGLK